jgi:hypothetical protein
MASVEQWMAASIRDLVTPAASRIDWSLMARRLFLSSVFIKVKSLLLVFFMKPIIMKVYETVNGGVSLPSSLNARNVMTG